MGIIVQGVDSTNIVRPLLLGSTGGVITSPAIPSTLFHVSGVWRDFTENLNAAAGTYWVDGAVCPVGERRVVVMSFMRNVQRAMVHPYMAIKSGGVYHYFYDIASLAINTFGVWQNEIVIVAGECVSYRFVAVTLNDDIIYGAAGYKMTI